MSYHRPINVQQIIQQSIRGKKQGVFLYINQYLDLIVSNGDILFYGDKYVRDTAPLTSVKFTLNN